jgi:Tfp pilus assembly protein FimT
MVELRVVIMMVFIIAGFALVDITGMMPEMRVNAALSQTVGQLRRGRELAIAQRRNIRLQFLGNNQIQLTRLDLPAGTTIISTVTLEDDVEFRLFGGVPDSPDGFGNGAAVDFGGADTLMFLTDGTFVDGQGNPLNGSVFLGLGDHAETARAVTLLGATGRVRGYRWTGSLWIQ